jgi:predicted deacylase
MPDASAFSPDYLAARARFRAAALASGAALEACPLDLVGPDGETLTIEVARLGSARAGRVVVVSSGLHGIEGFVGSAIQAALLEEGLGAWRPAADSALVLLHALNPWGMAHGRRVNEDNVDLNRNFLPADATWRGLPPGFGLVDPLLHPHGPAARVDTFRARALLFALRHGPAALNAPSVGQYDRPRGLFYGGNGPSRTRLALREHLPRWLGAAHDVLHLDLHAGVGARGRLLLFDEHVASSPAHERLAAAFPGEAVVPRPAETEVRGAFLPWVARLLPDCRFDGITVEIGTVGPIALLAALREENRAWHHDQAGTPSFVRARERLAEALVPTSRRWRDRVVPAGVRLLQRALRVGLGAE